MLSSTCTNDDVTLNEIIIIYRFFCKTSSSSSSYSVNPTNSKAKVGSEEGNMLTALPLSVGIERLLPVRTLAR
ncbi:hypothetical protein Hanom_Chr13g01212661 [Helianthus anomalus]